MTSICIQTREVGSVSACAVLEPEDLHVALVCTLPSAAQVLRLTLDPESAEELGKALLQMGKEMGATV